MEAKPINQVHLNLNYLKTKNFNSAGGKSVTGNQSADKVDFGSDPSLILAESLAFVNQKAISSFGSRDDLNLILEQQLNEINETLHKKALELTNTENNLPDQNDLDYFNAENTANRIYNFATSFYETFLEFGGKEDTQEARQEYADIIGEAIGEGFEDALSVLGVLPDKVSNEIQKTHDIVTEKLAAFVLGEEKTYNEKVTEKVTEKMTELDKDGSNDLSIDETNLSSDFFNNIDKDQNQRLSIEELSQEIKLLDKTKDLSDDLLNAVLEKSESFQEQAEKAHSLSHPSEFTISFLAQNPKVAQAVIGFSGGSSGNFAEFLKDNPDAVKKIIDDPSKLNEVIRAFKLDSITSKLKDNPITDEFLNAHLIELESLFDHPDLLDYFSINIESAQRLVDSY
ncbi:MAG: hypothetical protein COA79_15410 [Planctomycetota bacterium]|nr:MAG: hypothetical protein COA79_15410 [Planctomycetota bacterium]